LIITVLEARDYVAIALEVKYTPHVIGIFVCEGYSCAVGQELKGSAADVVIAERCSLGLGVLDECKLAAYIKRVRETTIVWSD